MCQGPRLAPSRIITLTKTSILPLTHSGLAGVVLWKRAVTILFIRFKNKAHLRHSGGTDSPDEIMCEQGLEGE